MRPLVAATALLLAGLVQPTAAEAPAGTYVLQFHGPLGPEERADLLALGVVPEDLRAIPGAVARLTPAQLDAVRARPYVERVDAEERVELHLDASRDLVRMEPSLTRGSGATGRGVTVVVVDSGLDGTHPDFEGRVAANLLWTDQGWRDNAADPDGHGTHVAGIVAGSGERSSGALVGFAPGARVVSLGFGDRFTTTVALRAFDWILDNREAHGIRVVVNSWGRAETGRAWDPGDALVRATDRLVREGVVVVFSASNHGAEGASTVALEAQNPNVVTVGAVDDAARPAPFSSRGPVRLADGTAAPWVKPDVVADGVAILSAKSAASADPAALPSLATVAPERAFYKEMQGTSQAAPAVAGLVACMLEVAPQLSPTDVKRILLETAVDLAEPGADDVTGFGLVDARDALAVAGGDAADRGNVIVAGGEDEFVARGRVVAAEGVAVQTEPSLGVRDDGTVEVAFPVKPGAHRVAFDFSWIGDSRVAVHLHDGARFQGTFTDEDREGARRLVRGAADVSEPGVWTLLARPASRVDLEWATTVRVAVKECPTCVAVVDPAYLAATPGLTTDGALYYVEDLVQQSREFARRAVDAPGPERTYALVGCACLGVAMGLRALRGR